MGRALVIRLTALGDVVLAEPVVRALRALLPRGEVDLVTDHRFAAWAGQALGADVCVGYDRHGADAGFAGVRAVASRLPTQQYDVVVDLQGKLRTRALSRQVNAERRLLLGKRSPGRALLALVGHDPPIDDRHTTQMYLDVLAPLGQLPDGFDPAPRLFCATRPSGRPRSRIGLSPGATHATKRWPAERFAELADALSQGDAERRFVLVGGPGDRALLDKIRALVRRASIEPLDVAQQDVAGLSASIADLDLLISVDTGPAHLAAALGVPVAVLFGPTSAVRWGPIGSAHRVIRLGIDCSPCSNIGGPECPKPERNHACMQDLSVAHVQAIVEQMLVAP